MIIKTCAVLALILAAASCLGSNFLWLPLYFLGYFLAFFLLAVLFCVIACALVDTKKPVKKESRFYRTILYPYVELLMNLFLVKLHTRGLEKTPENGRFLLVCNHQQFADPGILLHCFRKSQLTFISKQENRKLPIISKFMHTIRCQLLDRDNDRQGLRCIVECIRMIRADEVSVGVFPEGYTTKDGKIRHFRPGVFKIAQKTGVPIAVCTLDGPLPLYRDVVRLKHTPVELHLVDVIQPEQYAGLHTTEIANMVYEMMIADLGEEFRAEAPGEA